MQQLNTEWLDRSAAAILFLDERKHIVFANRAAQTLESDGMDQVRQGWYYPAAQAGQRQTPIVNY